MRNLITAREVIDLAFAENSNMREDSISATSIHIAEIKYIRPVFGEMFALLPDKYADFTAHYVKPALAYFVKCEIISSIAIDMSNSGVAVANPQYMSAASDKQRQRLYDSEMSKAKTLLDFALSYIASHKDEFPDFRGDAPKRHHRIGGLLLNNGSNSRCQSRSISGEAFKAEINRLDARINNLENNMPSGDVEAEYMQQLAYSELVALRDSGALVPGMMYRITDYVTLSTQANTRSARHPFDIIVTALDNRTLAAEAKAIQHECDTYFAAQNLSAWRVWYDLDNDTQQYAWAAEAERSEAWLTTWGALLPQGTATIDGTTMYLYAPAERGTFLDTKTFYRLVQTDIVISNPAEQLLWLCSDMSEEPDWEYDEETGEEIEITRYAFYDCRVFTESGVLLSTLGSEEGYSTTLYDSRDESYEYGVGFDYSGEEVEMNGSTYYKLIPTYGADDWWNEVQGAAIYDKVLYEGDTAELYYAFAKALTSGTQPSIKVVSSITGLSYRSDNWSDRVTYQSAIAAEEGGKGVIYRLIDENDNDLPYDFKNIQHSLNNVWYHTFDYRGADHSLRGWNYVRGNIVVRTNNKVPRIIFSASNNSSKFYDNRVEVIIADYALFKSGASGNSFLSDHAENTTFDTVKVIEVQTCHWNTVIGRIDRVLFGNNSAKCCTFDCRNLISYYNAAIDLSANASMYKCDCVLICSDWSVSKALTVRGRNIANCRIEGVGTFSYSDTNGNVKGGLSNCNINLGDSVGANIDLQYGATTSDTEPLSNLRISAQNWGDDKTVVTIPTTFPPCATYELRVAKNSSGDIKMWNEADLA